jgi:hypothetical protein
MERLSCMGIGYIPSLLRLVKEEGEAWIFLAIGPWLVYMKAKSPADGALCQSMRAGRRAGSRGRVRH